MTKRTVFVGMAIVAGGGVISHLLGSRPAARYGDGPLSPCPDIPNCAIVRVPLAADAQRVEEAALAAVRGDLPWWLGRPTSIDLTVGGVEAEFTVGLFRDRLAVAVEPDGEGSVLWIRSASAVGRTDLGINRLRVQRLTEAVRAELA